LNPPSPEEDIISKEDDNKLEETKTEQTVETPEVSAKKFNQDIGLNSPSKLPVINITHSKP
jgi:hypothetical protein